MPTSEMTSEEPRKSLESRSNSSPTEAEIERSSPGSAAERAKGTLAPGAIQLLQQQYRLPPELIRAMVQSEAPLTDKGIELAIRIARMYWVPLNGLTLFQDRYGNLRVFINSTGVFWRLHHDIRGVRSFHTAVAHAPTEAEPFLRARASLVMGDGSEYENEAWAYFRCVDGEWLERSRAGQWMPVNLGDRIMAGLTKAARRAASLAVGISLPIYEDAVGEAEQPEMEPETFAGFVRAVRAIGLTPADAARLIQMSLAEIAARPRDAWLALQAARKEAP